MVGVLSSHASAVCSTDLRRTHAWAGCGPHHTCSCLCRTHKPCVKQHSCVSPSSHHVPPLRFIEHMLHPSARYIFICRKNNHLTCCPDPNPNDVTLQPQPTGCDLIGVLVQT